MPDLVGLTRTEASQLLRTMGLVFWVETAGQPLDDIVVGQTPEPGVHLSSGAEVIIRARCLAAPCPTNPAGTLIYDPCSCDFR
ncbi:MAG: PASTA domain-containing protein [Actinobacteria bacterium]|nr:PASTA domain-containing protein [Actinomycetota bacterium]